MSIKLCFSQDSIKLLKKIDAVEKILRKELTYDKVKIDELLKASEDIKCISCIAKTHTCYGKLYFNLNEYYKTQKHAKLELKYNHKLKDSAAISLSYYRLSITNKEIGNFMLERSNLSKALLYLPKDNEDLKFNICIAQATLLGEIGDYQGLKEISLRLFKEEKEKKKDNNRLSYISEFLALGFLQTGNVEKAYDYYFLFKDYNERNFSKHKLGRYYYHLADFMLKIDSLKQAREYIQRSKKLLPNVTNKLKILEATYLLKAKEYKSSENEFKNLLRTQKELTNNQKFNIYKFLISISIKTKNYSKIEAYTNNFIAFNDSLNNQLDKQRLKSIEESQEIVEQQRELEANKFRLLKVEEESRLKLLLLIIIFVSLFAIGLGVYVLQTKKSNKSLALANIKIEESLKIKSKFINLMTHELRTPLNTIVGTIHLMNQENNTLSDNVKEHIRTLIFSTRYLGNLIENSVILKAIDNQNSKEKLIKQKQHFKLLEIIEEAGKMIKFFDNKNSFKININQNLPQQFVGPKIHLTQIIINLVNNANKFTENGLINVNVTGEAISEFLWSVKIEIADNGCGIPEEEQNKVFDEFFSGKDKDYKNFSGMGLGLTLTKRLLQLYGSKIELKSKVNVGTNISFTLNLEESVTKNKISDRQRLNINSNVLLVEDNLVNQKITKRIIENFGCKCDVASNGEEAIDKYKTGNYDIVLMDIMMPVLDGIEASKLILQYNINANIVLLTGVSKDSANKQIKALKIKDTLTKPIVVNELKNLLMT